MASEKVLVRPDPPHSDSIARISIEGDWVRVCYPEKRELFGKVVKRLDFVWKAPYWVREVKDTAAQPHRAAELVRDLLAARFCVKAERGIIDMVLNEAFDEETRRKVLVRDAGTYEGWFMIWWKRDEDVYHAAKRLPGAKYDKPFVVVPPENYEAVLDFATINGFVLSEGAQALVEEAKAEREAAIVVSVIGRETAVAPTNGMPKLAVPDEVEIDDSLIDEPL